MEDRLLLPSQNSGRAVIVIAAEILIVTILTVVKTEIIIAM